nr:MAG TPA: hypothetical protein [Caudoviricetes sp.]
MVSGNYRFRVNRKNTRRKISQRQGFKKAIKDLQNKRQIKFYYEDI